ncbi:MAG TPA: hypothetical protein VFZ03_01065 [Dongiaceae bacterium]
MRTPRSMRGLEAFSRTRLSPSFYMRDFLYSEVAGFHGIPNLPDDPDLAIAVGRALCETLLEPLQAAFGRIAIRAAFRSRRVTAAGHERGECGSVTDNAAYHIWDLRDAEGRAGGCATVVVPWFTDRYAATGDWKAMGWWIHDHLPYSHIRFMPRLAAINIQWHQQPKRRIDSFLKPRGCLTRPGMANHDGSHRVRYPDFPRAALAAPRRR